MRGNLVNQRRIGRTHPAHCKTASFDLRTARIRYQIVWDAQSRRLLVHLQQLLRALDLYANLRLALAEI